MEACGYLDYSKHIIIRDVLIGSAKNKRAKCYAVTMHNTSNEWNPSLTSRSLIRCTIVAIVWNAKSERSHILLFMYLLYSMNMSYIIYNVIKINYIY